MPTISDTARNIFNQAKRSPHGIRISCDNLAMAIKLAKKFRAFIFTEGRRNPDVDPYLGLMQARVHPHESNPTRDKSLKFYCYIEPIDHEFRTAKIEELDKAHIPPGSTPLLFEDVPENLYGDDNA